MAGDVAFACICGQVAGVLTEVSPSAGAQVVCHCTSCRAADVYLGQPDPVDGVALFQTTPDRVRFQQGQDKLALFCLAKGGLFRWHASCCKAPLFNTMPGPGFAFASLHVARVADPGQLGPVTGHVNVPKGDQSHRNAGLARTILGVLRRTVAARLSGRWKRTPFFDMATKTPVVAPRILSDEDRSGLSLS